MDKSLTAIVLAAGQDTRTKSALPKVLHPVCGVPMLDHVVRAAKAAGATKVVVVVGHGREAVEEHLRSAFGPEVVTAVQAEQRGTGHAARCGLEAVPDATGDVAILCGDVPLLEPEAIERLREV